ncbi:hypothetical protein [Thermoleptolyngbya sp.]
MNFLDFGRFLAGAAREKSSNCVSPTYINSRFWIGDFGWLIPELTRLPTIASVALFPRIDITPDSLMLLERIGLGGFDAVRGYAQNQIVADNAL